MATEAISMQPGKISFLRFLRQSVYKNVPITCNHISASKLCYNFYFEKRTWYTLGLNCVSYLQAFGIECQEIVQSSTVLYLVYLSSIVLYLVYLSSDQNKKALNFKISHRLCCRLNVCSTYRCFTVHLLKFIMAVQLSAKVSTLLESHLAIHQLTNKTGI